jgi:hypothetical protein
MGMTLGLAALSAWGVGHFQGLMSVLELPLRASGESVGAFAQKVAEYQGKISLAGLSLFHGFLRVGALISLLATLPALALQTPNPQDQTSYR